MHCSHFDAGRCRSCTQLPIPYDQQLTAKQQHCQDVLAAHEGLQWLPSVPSAEAGFRNKAKMVVSGPYRRPVLGILDAQGQGVDLRDCGLYSPGLQSCFGALSDFITLASISPYNIALRRGELKYLLVTESDIGELMIRFTLRSEEPLERMRRHLPELLEALPQLKVVSANLQPEHKAILEGEREILLTEESQLTIHVNDLPLHLRPQSFFQTNTAIAAALYAQARDWVDELEPASVWDLYCGAGGFALHSASPWRDVTGVETSADAIASAEQSRDELGLKRLSFRTLEAGAFAAMGEAVPELVIVNPPRRGIGADLSRFLNDSTARWLIYSSCNVESLARDLALMPQLKPQQARLLDMFPHTEHYEVILLLERAEAVAA